MTNSDQARAPDEILDQLLAELSEDELRREVDNWIAGAAEGFEYKPGAVCSQRAFLEVLGGFVRHVYKAGLRVPQPISFRQSQAEAIALLDRYYRSADDVGYDAAFLDATSPDDNGMEVVLSRVTETIKSREREKYTRWIVTRWLAPCTWTEKCAIAAHFVARFHRFLPPRLCMCNPAQLVDEIPDLLKAHLSTEGSMMKLLCIAGFSGDC
jgi:hypothetical protein